MSRTKRVVQQTLKAISENKFQGYSPTNQCIQPVNKPGGGTQPISYHFFNAGVNMASLLPEFTNPMNLFQFNQGDASDQRIGRYMYIRKSTVKFEVQMSETAGPVEGSVPVPPINEFRLMVVKARRSNNRFGVFPNPGKDLFLDTQNGDFGYLSTTTATFMHHNQPINKREWIVYKDTKFKLSCPSVVKVEDPSTTTPVPINQTNNRYPSKKMFRLKFPVFKKTFFNDAGVPGDLDTQWMVILMASPSNYCQSGTAPKNYFVNALGTTSALDN